MSAGGPRSCLKPALRNPWVAEDNGGGESSTSSGGPPPGTHDVVPAAPRPQDVLAHQYATPFTPSSSYALGCVSGHPSHNAALTYTAAHTGVTSARGGHGVVHSHTAHSLHVPAHPHPHSSAHSVHSVPGSLHHQPWVEPQLLWSGGGLGGVPGGVFTVAGGADTPCPGLPQGMFPQHLQPLHHVVHPGPGSSSGQASSSGGWGVPTHHPHHQADGSSGGGGLAVAGGGWRGGGGEGGRCQRCHHYCFLSAQAIFVLGIVVGFSLLVAGGVFQRHHVAHFQVLVYIGAMVSLVCVVLLVIFCAVNKDHRARRSGAATRFPPGPHTHLDPEQVPLRAIEGGGGHVVGDGRAGTGADSGVGGSSMELLHQTNHHTAPCLITPGGHGGCYVPQPNHGCMVAPPNNMCFLGPGQQGPVMVPNHGTLPPSSSSDLSHHIAQPRHLTRLDEEHDGSHRYNRLWRQPSKPSSENTSKL